MTHYEIDYEGMNQQLADRKAIRDIKDYLGVKKFNEVTPQFVDLRRVKGEAFTADQLGFYVMLAGISGYPVHAWHRHVVRLAEECTPASATPAPQAES